MKRQLLLAGVIALSLDGSQSRAEIREMLWTPRTSQSIPKMAPTVAVDGKIYTIAGYRFSTFLEVTTVEMYDPAIDTWASRATKPTARSNFGVAVVDGKVYTMGGGYTLNFYGETEVFDPVANSWQSKTGMPTWRAGLAAAAVNGKIYAIGGIGCCVPLPTVEEYDPVGDTWTSKADKPTTMQCLAAVAYGGKIYTFGGDDAVEVYDPAANTWSTRNKMDVGRWDPGAVLLNGKIYLVSGDSLPPRVDEYDPVTDSWIPCTPMARGRRGNVAVAVNGQIYAMGGEAGGSVEVGRFLPPPFVLRGGKGKIVVAPNVYVPGSGKGVAVAMKGRSGESVDLAVYDSLGAKVAEFIAVLDGTGEARMTYGGRDSQGRVLPPGLYWIVAKGGGVDDKKGFAVKAR